MRFISIDSSLRNTGIALGSINKEGNVHIHDIHLHSTEKTKNKQVRASSDLIESCRSTHRFIEMFVFKYNPDFIFIETPSGSQSASGMKSYGATCQLIGALDPIPIEVTPNEVKMASVNKKTASKAEMIDWAYNKFSGLQWLKSGDRLLKKNEHLADAIAVAFAGIKTNEFQRVFKIASK